MSDRNESVLTRWSRLKRQAPDEARPTPPVPTGQEFGTPDVADAPPTGTEPSDAPLPEAPDADAPPLPRLEDLTSDTDLGAFFRKGVPEELRTAALRRMWSLDPAIRDFVNFAADYAWDWNAPEGVPGFFGALPSTADVGALLAQATGIAAPPDEVPTFASAPLDVSRRADPEPADSGPGEPPAPEEQDARPTPALVPFASARVADAPQTAGSDEADTVRTSRRRHGGATPA